MKEKIKMEKDNPARLRYDDSDYIQVFFESNDVEIMNGIVENVELESKYGKINLFNFENKFYIVINLIDSTTINNIRHVLSEEIIKKSAQSTLWEKKNLSSKNLLNEEPFFTSGDKYIKIYSIQPLIK